MVRSNANSVEHYIAELPHERADAIREVREVILKNLPDGYVESMTWGMPTYEVPLERFGDTYNKKPLMYAALASQKNYMVVYLSTVYSSEEAKEEFATAYKATGKKLDMGKSCVRFKTLDQLPLDVIADTIAATTVDEFLAQYQAVKG